MALEKTLSPARLSDQLLRAIAIICVILIHFLAMFHDSPFVSSSPYQLVAVSLDQLSRLSVPLFVALSGYGLSQKYLKTEFRWSEFLTRRVLKLLPLYIVWSIFYYVALRVVPGWTPTWETTSLPVQLLLGQADYQMYFVPMIFQLYLLFPFLFQLRRRWPLSTLIVFGCIQVVMFFFFQNRQLMIGNFLVTDQVQYLFCGTWIFYFVLGMCLPRLHRMLKSSAFLTSVLIAVTLAGGYWIINNALSNINQGMNPLYALRFTRYVVLFYASASIVLLSWLAMKVRRLPVVIQQIGTHSYGLYLAHTFLLRVIFSIGILR